MKAIAPSTYIPDGENTFLQLFPHRFDFIYAEHPQPGESPQWQTESRYPLSDRVIQQGTYLYGVRFSKQTCYAVLDVDDGSPYHPQHDPFAISRMIAALEPIGLVIGVICTSSYSGGLHLYLPFTNPQPSWELGLAIATLLQNAGFVLKPGQLEVFPNPKPYQPESEFSLFNAHRLPLQIGSYLVDEAYQPIWSDQHRFVQQWQLAQSRNSVSRIVMKQVIKQARRKQHHISGKADQFLNDLNAEIELGWTGPGQTNRLLGRIALRCYVFHHVLHGGQPLEGQPLVDEIVQIARSLPGYEQWCQHQHEIEQRSREWARCVEASRYFPYGRSHGKYQPKVESTASSNVPSVSWNQQQSEATREKIRRAIAHLLENNSLPASITARFQALTRYGIGGGSLYRHRDLWHPNYLYAVESEIDRLTFGEPALLEPASINSIDPSLLGPTLLDPALVAPDVIDPDDSNPGLSDPAFCNPDDVEKQPVENPPHPPVLLGDSAGDALSTPSPALYPASLFPQNGSNSSCSLSFQVSAPSLKISTACKTDWTALDSSFSDLPDVLAEISALIHQLNGSCQTVQESLHSVMAQRGYQKC